MSWLYNELNHCTALWRHCCCTSQLLTRVITITWVLDLACNVLSGWRGSWRQGKSQLCLNYWTASCVQVSRLDCMSSVYGWSMHVERVVRGFESFLLNAWMYVCVFLCLPFVMAVRDGVLNIFAADLHIWRPSPSSTTWGRAISWWEGTHWVVSLFKLESKLVKFIREKYRIKLDPDWSFFPFLNGQFNFLRRTILNFPLNTT